MIEIQIIYVHMYIWVQNVILHFIRFHTILVDFIDKSFILIHIISFSLSIETCWILTLGVLLDFFFPLLLTISYSSSQRTSFIWMIQCICFFYATLFFIVDVHSMEIGTKWKQYIGEKVFISHDIYQHYEWNILMENWFTLNWKGFYFLFTWF